MSPLSNKEKFLHLQNTIKKIDEIIKTLKILEDQIYEFPRGEQRQTLLVKFYSMIEFCDLIKENATKELEKI